MPPDQFDGTHWKDHDHVIAFSPTLADLQRFADQLEQEMKAFPERTEISGSRGQP